MIGSLKGASGIEYTIGREIGRGGFGVVHLATGSDRADYAVKILGPATDTSLLETFEREVQLRGRASHPNLLEIMDFGSFSEHGNDYLFAITPYCPGGSYRLRLKQHPAGQTNLDLIITDITQVLSGLSALHAHTFHRDVKPENILIDGGTLKVADFGLSKLIDEATRTMTFKGGGSPRYMAPEVWDAHRASAATDLYAVGVMLFEALTGRPPFIESDVNALRQAHCFKPAPRARSFAPDTPAYLDGVVKKLLEKDSGRRFQTAGEVITALAQQPAGENSDIAGIVTQVRQRHDEVERAALEKRSAQEARKVEQDRNRLKEVELIELVDEVVAELNEHLVEARIVKRSDRRGAVYSLGARSLVVRFFAEGELYAHPIVPGRMALLRQRQAVHGGIIEIQENGQDREGWNVVLVRPEESLYGEWILIETEVSPLTGRATRYSPVATEAQLLADNLSSHWGRAMHTWQLKDRKLTRDDVVKIFGVFAK